MDADLAVRLGQRIESLGRLDQLAGFDPTAQLKSQSGQALATCRQKTGAEDRHIGHHLEQLVPFHCIILSYMIICRSIFRHFPVFA
jgi:hypothetical protein